MELDYNDMATSLFFHGGYMEYHEHPGKEIVKGNVLKVWTILGDSNYEHDDKMTTVATLLEKLGVKSVRREHPGGE